MRLGYIRGSKADIDQIDHKVYKNIDKLFALFADCIGENKALKELQWGFSEDKPMG